MFDKSSTAGSPAVKTGQLGHFLDTGSLSQWPSWSFSLKYSTL